MKSLRDTKIIDSSPSLQNTLLYSYIAYQVVKAYRKIPIQAKKVIISGKRVSSYEKAQILLSNAKVHSSCFVHHTVLVAQATQHYRTQNIDFRFLHNWILVQMISSNDHEAVVARQCFYHIMIRTALTKSHLTGDEVPL